MADFIILMAVIHQLCDSYCPYVLSLCLCLRVFLFISGLGLWLLILCSVLTRLEDPDLGCGIHDFINFRDGAMVTMPRTSHD